MVDAMDAPQKKLPTYVWYALAIICMLALYVLSIGPVFWLIEHRYIQWNTVAMAYRPIFWVAMFGPKGMYGATMWYLHVWTGREWGIEPVDLDPMRWAPRLEMLSS
jgi:hypothetical protein